MEINFRHEINGQKVITAIAQDWKTGQILMVANMNKDALQKTIETGKAHYWSTSRNSQWLKGESSKHFFVTTPRKLKKYLLTVIWMQLF